MCCSGRAVRALDRSVVMSATEPGFPAQFHGRSELKLIVLLLLSGAILSTGTAYAQPHIPVKAGAAISVPPMELPPGTSWNAAVMEASARFAIPENWLQAVIAVESGGDSGARSPKGAMGLMQIMPATWAALSQRERLGLDPFDPHANVLAGAACLRDMIDRYGDLPSALSAYNAGPGRTDDWRQRGRPLPSETLSYVTRVLLRLGFGSPAALQLAHGPAALAPVDWRASSLFGSPVHGTVQARRAAFDSAGDGIMSARPLTATQGLFVAVSRRSVP